MLVVTECKWCGEEFDYDYAGRGRAREFCCADCRNEYSSRHRKRYKHECRVCSKKYETYRKVSSFCSSTCASKSSERKPRDCGKLIKCKACGKQKRVPLDRLAFCSRQCAFRWRKANSALVILRFSYCEGECGKMLFNGRKMCKECRSLDAAYRRLESLEYRCVDCGKWGHKVTTQSYRRRCDLCGIARGKVVAKEYYATENGRSIKRTAKRNRKHKLRVAKAESSSFSEWSLFARDRWKCQLCGRKVRKVIRETNYDDEATIDHIIPLSRGGKHSMANCQTACRACNTLKGAKVVGQHRLF